MRNKIHFKFLINNIPYIYPLIIRDNTLSYKPLPYGTTKIGDWYIYLFDIPFLNYIINLTIFKIKEILDNVDFLMKKKSLLSSFNIFTKQNNTSGSSLVKQNNPFSVTRITEHNPTLKIRGGSEEKNKLNSIKKKYLREYCKKNKLKGYSKYNKKDLINFIKKYFIINIENNKY
jgi:hypothetical protein